MGFGAKVRAVGQLIAETVENMTLPPEGSSLVDIIMHTTRDFHSEHTGGTLHKINLATAHIITGYILAYGEAKTPLRLAPGVYVVHYPLIAALIAGESCFDPMARNPNMQDAKPGATPADIEKNTDFGLGQINGGSVFLGNIPLSVSRVAQTLIDNLVWAQTVPAPAVEVSTKGVDAFSLAMEAYNKGQVGALESDDFTYGDGVVARYDSYCKTLKIPIMHYPVTEVGQAPFGNRLYNLSDLKQIAAADRAKWAK